MHSNFGVFACWIIALAATAEFRLMSPTTKPIIPQIITLAATAEFRHTCAVTCLNTEIIALAATAEFRLILTNWMLCQTT